MVSTGLEQSATLSAPLLDRTVLKSSALEQMGLREKNVFDMTVDESVEHHYILKNPGLYRRFHIPKIGDSRPFPHPTVVIEEWLAGLTPSFNIIPEDKQRQIESMLTQQCLPSGYIAKIEGVVFPRRYSNVVADAYGLNPTLERPNIGIHIYRASDGRFEKQIVLHFIDKLEVRRIDAINKKIERLSQPERELFEERIRRLYRVLSGDGLMERLIEEPKGVGQLASLRGFSVIDLMEIVLNYPDEKAWLDNIDPQSRQLNLSPQQRVILQLRKNKYLDGKDIKDNPLLPRESSIIEEAISIARQRGETPEFIEGLESRLVDFKAGIRRYHHNIARGGLFRKPLSLAEVSGGYLSFYKLLDILLERGKIIPREATYSKGTYFQCVDLSVDDPVSLQKFVLYAMDPAEKIKNIRTHPIIIEIGSSNMPRFKHQENVVRYTPTVLHDELRRVIVHDKSRVDYVQTVLEKCGYTGVTVIDIETWRNEVSYLSEAKKRLIEQI